MINREDMPEILEHEILKNPEFLDMLAKRIVKRISSGESEGNETIRQIGDFHFTAFQLDRFKKACIFLANNDAEFKKALRRALKIEGFTRIPEPLTREQLITRIMQWGPLAFQFKGRMNGFFCNDIFAALGEYSRTEVTEMLKNTGLWLRNTNKKHPKTGKFNRAYILDI